MGEEGFVKNMSHAVIHCRDIKATIGFYQLLGFNVDRIISHDFNNPGDINDLDSIPLNRTPSGDFYCVGMGLGSTDPKTITRLELMQWSSPEKHANYPSPADHLGLVRLAFSVSGASVLAARLAEQGHRVDPVETIDISPTLSSVYAHAYDPDGNWVTLMEWVKHPK